MATSTAASFESGVGAQYQVDQSKKDIVERLLITDLLEIIFEDIATRQQSSLASNGENRFYHRYQGTATYASLSRMARAVLVGKAVEPYRQVVDQIRESEQPMPANRVVIHLFLPLGSAESLYVDRGRVMMNLFAALANLSHGKNGLMLIQIHPIDCTQMSSTLREVAEGDPDLQLALNSEELEQQIVEKLVALVRSQRKIADQHALDRFDPINVGVSTTDVDIQRAIREVSADEDNSHLFVVVNPSTFSNNFGYLGSALSSVRSNTQRIEGNKNIWLLQVNSQWQLREIESE